MSSSKVLEVRDLKRVIAERTIITNLSFSVRAGETLFVRGASGVGKSLLLRALAYLDPIQVGLTIMPSVDQAIINMSRCADGGVTLLRKLCSAFPMFMGTPCPNASHLSTRYLVGSVFALLPILTDLVRVR